MAKKKETASLLDLPVAFSNVSIGDRTARIGATMGREVLSASQADKNFCGRRLVGKLIGKDNDAHGDQGNLDGFEDLELKGCFDVKSLSLTPKTIGIGLTFSLQGLDLATIGHFAKRNGRLIVSAVEEIPESEQSNGESEE